MRKTCWLSWKNNELYLLQNSVKNDDENVVAFGVKYFVVIKVSKYHKLLPKYPNITSCCVWANVFRFVSQFDISLQHREGFELLGFFSWSSRLHCYYWPTLSIQCFK